MIATTLLLGLASGLLINQSTPTPKPDPIRTVQLSAHKDIQDQALVGPKTEKARFFCLIFLGAECPVSNGYSPEYKRLFDEYQPKGVWFLGVHPDPDVDVTRASQHAKEYQLPFPIVLDPRQKLATSSGVTITPQVALLDAKGKVVWIGRIDDNWMPNGKKRTTVTQRDLRKALDALLEGKTPPPPTAAPYGCPLPEINHTPGK